MEYNVIDFFKYALPKLYIGKKLQHKNSIQFTSKIKLLLTITILLELLTLIYFYINIFKNYSEPYSIIIFLLIIIAIYQLSWIYVLISLLVIYPFQRSFEIRLIKKAVKKVNSIKDIKIIMVVGSYGKTSTTNFLNTLLSYDYKVFSPNKFSEGRSINTIIGISQRILKDMDSHTEILLIEAGAYKIGEIREIAENFSPDVTIITSIGTQHLEKFKNIGNIIKAGKEAVDYSKTDATIIAPKDIYEYPFDKYDIQIEFSENKKYIKTEYKILDIKKNEIHFKVNKDTFKTKLLGYSMISNLTLAIECAKLFNIKNIQGKINLISPTKRRMYPYEKDSITYIDDSYNIGEESAQSAIKFLKDMKDKNLYRNIYVATGGIVERGNESSLINKKYGELLDKSVDKILLYDSPFKNFIISGIKNKNKIINIKNIYDIENHKSEFNENGCVLIQNDITDEYYIKNL